MEIQAEQVWFTKCEKEISAPTFPQEKYMLKWLQIER